MQTLRSGFARKRVRGLFVTAIGAAILSFMLVPTAAWALTCSSTNVPNCGQCKNAVCIVDGDTASWSCQVDATKNGLSCTDNNACTTGDVCSNGTCAGTPVTCSPIDACHTAGTCSVSTGTCSTGTLTCVPGIPGPVTGPSTSSNGAYALSWGSASGVVWS